MSGEPPPTAQHEADILSVFRDSGSACGALAAGFDWGATPLGPPGQWPAELRALAATVFRTPRPMALLWGREGTLLYNDACSRIAGDHHPGAFGTSVLRAWPEVAEFLASVIETALDGDSLTYRDLPLQIDRGQGPEEARFDLDYSPVVDAGGRPAGVLAIIAETTQAARAREAAQEREAEEARRARETLDAVGNLTGELAHDFNNLLMPIMAALDILRRKLPDEKSQRLISAGLLGAERASTLVQRLLAFSGRQMLQARSLSPSGMLEGLRDLIEKGLPSGIEVRFEVPADLPNMTVDPAQLEIAILNLVANARDAMPSGGRLTIAAGLVDTDEEPVPGLPPGRYVSIAVADTGSGMDEGTRRRAVEPFFTTKAPGQGTGLGLSMVHGLAAQSGGTFLLLSESGRGTSAVIFLPVAGEEAAAEDDAPSRPRPVVLLVDDEEIVRMSMAEGLRELGYDVEEVGTAAEALEAIRSGFNPDVVVTDHVMPGMLGADLAAELRRVQPGLPVLMITGYAQLTPEQARGLPVLSKPFRQADLANRLVALLSEHDGKVVPFHGRAR